MTQETQVHDAARNESLPPIRMTRHDAGGIDTLLADYPAETRLSGAGLLLRELLRAEVVPAEAIDSSTVVMHSVVSYLDHSTDETRTVKLVYPVERSTSSNALSVLAPLGAALIGLSEGQSISYEGVDGRERVVSVLKVHSQPAGGARRR